MRAFLVQLFFIIIFSSAAIANLKKMPIIEEKHKQTTNLTSRIKVFSLIPEDKPLIPYLEHYKKKDLTPLLRNTSTITDSFLTHEQTKILANDLSYSRDNNNYLIWPNPPYKFYNTIINNKDMIKIERLKRQNTIEKVFEDNFNKMKVLKKKNKGKN